VGPGKRVSPSPRPPRGRAAVPPHRRAPRAPARRSAGGSATVGPRRVAHVAREPVARVAHVQLAHDRVAVDLRDDRSGGDRAHEGVALRVGALRNREVGNLTPVDEHEAGDDGEPFDGATERGEPRLVDVHPVDLRRLDDRHGDGNGTAADLGGEPLAHPRRQHLRVGDAVDARARRQHDGGGDDGARERAHPHLVHARDVADADPPEKRLQVRGRRHRPARLLPRAPRSTHPRAAGSKETGRGQRGGRATRGRRPPVASAASAASALRSSQPSVPLYHARPIAWPRGLAAATRNQSRCQRP
jgi:hypothetical protein